MTRTIKDLAIAIVACLAMSAVAASGAQAVEFHSGVEHTTISGSQIGSHIFTVGSGAGNISCKGATFNGTGTKTTSSEQTVIPEYVGCVDSLFGTSAAVTCLSCGYIFTPTTGEIDIEGEFVIHLGTGCTITIKAQKLKGGTVYDNKENGDVVVTTDITNKIVTTTTGGFFACGVPNGEHKEGSYTGETTVTATATSGSPVGIFVA